MIWRLAILYTAAFWIGAAALIYMGAGSPSFILATVAWAGSLALLTVIMLGGKSD
jgi:hypothetical protein